jgi:D-alanyl-D-alanine dipeptidase
MTAPLNEITITSVYTNKNGERVPLPKRMALCTPDMEAAIRAVSAQLSQHGGRLFLSDLFRSFDMQLQSHMDFVNGKKTAFSPPPGGSTHEAGRALDLDLDSLKVTLADFWEIARPQGLLPIIDKPDPKLKESWH